MSSSLNEMAADAGAEEHAALARNVDASLEAVEEILGALLDISRLDAGATKPEISATSRCRTFSASSRSSSVRSRAQGPQAQSSSPPRSTSHRPASDAPPAAEFRLQRDQIYAARAGCWSVAGAPAPTCELKSGTPASACPRTSTARSSTNSCASIRARAPRAASASACRSWSASAASSTIPSRCARGRAEARFSRWRRRWARESRCASPDALQIQAPARRRLARRPQGARHRQRAARRSKAWKCCS